MAKASLNLRTKILTITLGISIAAIAAMVVIVILFIKPRLEAKLEKRGASIAHAISSQCVDPLLSREFFQLDLFFRDFISTEKDVAYIYVLTANGEVASHSFGSDFPVALKQAWVSAVKTARIARFATTEQNIIEISLPLLDGSLGSLHVGMSDESIKKDVNDILMWFCSIAAIFFMSSLLLLFVLEWWVVKPIFMIRSTSAKVKGGDVDSRVPVRTSDEIGKLAEDFNSMLDALGESRATLLHEKQLLAKSEKRFRAIIQQSPISMAIVSMDGAIEYINDYAIETFGFQPEDIPHMQDWWLKAYPDPAYREQVMAQWTGLVEKAVAEDRYIERREYRVVCKDGTVKTVLIFGVLIADKVFVVFEDISMRKQAEDEIIQFNNRLEEIVSARTEELSRSNRDLASFCYAISHELRAPVARLAGLSQVLQEDWAENTADAEFCVKRIAVASKELQRVIDSVLQLSRLSQSAFVLQPLNLSEMVRDIAGSLANEHPERSVEFTIAHDVTARGDASLVRLCLENLIGNAFKYTSRTPAARIEFGYDAAADEFFVKDNGIGFEMSPDAKIFEPFVRLHREDEFAGSGIGLATVQRIIERHGGRIRAVASPGQGATFYFTLNSSGGCR